MNEVWIVSVSQSVSRRVIHISTSPLCSIVDKVLSWPRYNGLIRLLHADPFLIRRAARRLRCRLDAGHRFQRRERIDRILPLPKARFNHDPIGKRHILERMAIDTQSATEHVRLSVDMDGRTSRCIRWPRGGSVLRSGSWLLAPGQNELLLDATGWPAGKLELSVLTRRDLMKLDFER